MEAYCDEMDLLRKSLGFFDLVSDRLAMQLDGLDQLAAAHFRVRWNITRNLYQIAIENHRRYLTFILSQPHVDDMSLYLRRNNILKNLKQQS